MDVRVGRGSRGVKQDPLGGKKLGNYNAIKTKKQGIPSNFSQLFGPLTNQLRKKINNPVPWIFILYEFLSLIYFRSFIKKFKNVFQFIMHRKQFNNRKFLFFTRGIKIFELTLENNFRKSQQLNQHFDFFYFCLTIVFIYKLLDSQIFNKRILIVVFRPMTNFPLVNILYCYCKEKFHFNPERI